MADGTPVVDQAASHALETQDSYDPVASGASAQFFADLPPEISARYEVLRALGRGASGIVYQGRDRETGDIVAIKLLRPDLATSPGVMERFKNELRLARQITHQNVCRIHEFQRAGTTAFITMESVDGESLRSLLGRRRKLPWREALRIIDGICAGLEAAHRRGIIHRDLKPANVMVQADGQVKVMDFGIAQTVRDDDTLTHAIVGTPLYMSPEQAAGRPAGLQSDIYSAGLILYESLTGEHPLFAESRSAVLLRQMRDTPLPICEVDPSIPASIEEIVERCLEKKTELRYASIEELRAALAQAAAAPTQSAWPFKRIAMVAALVIFNIAALWVPLRGRIAHATSRPNLAVLPCAESPVHPEDRAYCDGVAEMLASRLAKSADLNVVPLREVLDRRVKTARAAREELGAKLVLTAAFERSNGQARVQLSVVSTGDAEPPRSETIIASLADSNALQNEIVAAAARILNVSLPSPPQGATKQNPAKPPSPALDLYTQGRGYLQESDKAENLASAILLFEDAVRQDPKFALAYAAIADADQRKFRVTRDKKWLDDALKACQRAVDLDGSLPEGQTCLGQALAAQGQYEEAVAHYRLALSKAPANDLAARGLAEAYGKLNRLNDAEAAFRAATVERPQYYAAYSWLGAFYMQQTCYPQAADAFRKVVTLAPDGFRGYSNLGGALITEGDYAEAVRVLEKSLAIRVTDSGLNNLGVADLSLHRYAEAASVFQQAISFGPKRYPIWGNLAQARYFANQRAAAATAYRRARELAQDELRVNPREAKVAADLARFSARLGDGDAARSYLSQALSLAPDNGGVLLTAAFTRAQLGDRDGTLELIARAFAAGEPLSEVDDAPDFDLLHNDPRYREILRKQSKLPLGGQSCRLTQTAKR